MKIKEIRSVTLNIPKTPPKSKSRRQNWNNSSPRALPINKYPEFSTKHGQMPGANSSEEVWVQVIAEDGTWGLGETSFGEIRDKYLSQPDIPQTIEEMLLEEDLPKNLLSIKAVKPGSRNI